MRVWKMLCDRNALHLDDVEALPFFRPQAAEYPEPAARALREVSRLFDTLASLSPPERAVRYEAMRPDFDRLVFEYFGLTESERRRVEEAVAVFLPSVRPRSMKSLDTVAQHRATEAQIRDYATTLTQSLDSWSKGLGGRGRFEVSVRIMDPHGAGAMGAIRITLGHENCSPSPSHVDIGDAAVRATLQELARQAIVPIPGGDLLQLSPDTLLWTNDALYLVRPLSRRAWMERAAVRDAEHIVRDVQSRARVIPKDQVA
jgi:hypothetical protein